MAAVELSRDPGLCNVENLTSAQWHQLGLRESPGCAKEVFHGKQERVSPLALASPRAHLEGISHDFQLPPGRRQKKKKKKNPIRSSLTPVPLKVPLGPEAWPLPVSTLGVIASGLLHKPPSALFPSLEGLERGSLYSPCSSEQEKLFRSHILRSGVCLYL